jgi:hypothetical protein
LRSSMRSRAAVDAPNERRRRCRTARSQTRVLEIFWRNREIWRRWRGQIIDFFGAPHRI